MICRCEDLTELWDEEAKSYADWHLEQVEVRAGGWEILYRCPKTGRRWLKDYPHGEEHGGGPVKLRQLLPFMTEEW